MKNFNVFKTKFTLLTKDWEVVYNFKSRVKPNKDEYIYVGKFKTYFKVLNVVHSFDKMDKMILVVEKVKNLDEKLD